jgi:uncharacterized membrane protein
MEKIIKIGLNINWQLPPNWLRFIIISVLAIGIFFRFVNLDKKIYWGDEAATSFWISGYDSSVISLLYTGEIIQVEDLQKYQKIFPGTGVIDTVNAVAKNTPLHPPLYFALVRLWVGVFGDSITAIRAFSAVISLCVFPAIYWLCWELFNSSLVGWIAIALTAVCPYQVLYAQEARPYILWAVTILLSSACLLRAIRINKPLNWGLYAIALAASLYTNVFSVLVAIGQGIYILVIQGFKLNKIFSKIVINYLLASFGGILLFSPWMSLLINYQIHREIEPGTPFLVLSKRLIGIISRIFLDLGIDSSDEIKKVLPLTIPILLILITIGWSFYFLYRTTRKATWGFVFTLTGCCLIPFFIRDILTSTGTFLISNRYLFPSYLGIEIAVAYLLAHKIIAHKIIAHKITKVKIHWQQKFWQLVFLSLLSAGILSGIVSSQAEVWWHKGGPITKHELEVVYIVNQSSHPLIVSDAGWWNIMNLSSKLDAKVRLQLFNYRQDPTIRFQRLLEPEVIAAYNSYSDVFLFRPSEELFNQFEKINHHSLESVKEQILWKK